jgi:hypothetical protein
MKLFVLSLFIQNRTTLMQKFLPSVSVLPESLSLMTEFNLTHSNQEPGLKVYIYSMTPGFIY